MGAWRTCRPRGASSISAAARAHSSARFQRQHPGWELFGCDVSERYRAFVEPLTGPGGFRVTPLEPTGSTPAGPFDLVTMFFVAEHLIDPAATLGRVASLLAPTGFLYLTVPNVVTNTIDAFLADHLSHFSAPSLGHAAWQRCGLRPIVVSEHHQLGQITLMAVPEPGFAGRPARRGSDRPPPSMLPPSGRRSRAGSSAARGLVRSCGARPDTRGALAIYGAGVFGSYLALQVGAGRSAPLTCFLDQNPFKVGKTHRAGRSLHPRQTPAGRHRRAPSA